MRSTETELYIAVLYYGSTEAMNCKKCGGVLYLNTHLSSKKYRCATCSDKVQVRVKTYKNRLFAEPDAKSPMLTIARAINGKKEDLGGYPCELVCELTNEIRAYRARFYASDNDDSECQSCPKCNRLAYQRSRDHRFFCTHCRNVFEDKYEG